MWENIPETNKFLNGHLFNPKLHPYKLVSGSLPGVRMLIELPNPSLEGVDVRNTASMHQLLFAHFLQIQTFCLENYVLFNPKSSCAQTVMRDSGRMMMYRTPEELERVLLDRF